MRTGTYDNPYAGVHYIPQLGTMNLATEDKIVWETEVSGAGRANIEKLSWVFTCCIIGQFFYIVTIIEGYEIPEATKSSQRIGLYEYIAQVVFTKPEHVRYIG
jgi:hypothetical protein